MNLTLNGQVIAKKNARQLFVRNGRMMNIPSKLYREWEEDCLNQIAHTYRGQAEGQVIIIVEFYHKDLRKRDIDNELSSVLDLLVKAELIPDDSCEVVVEAHAIFGGVDKLNPRCEISLEEMEKV